ncbi:MAG: DUF1700 domain-containing protein [Acetatifactor sp.]|nr:DUF1700 domain-containing protein [Acetatifactor sp.]
MNKVEFMRQLERLLQNISEQERTEALHYYEDYFDDAGPENEQAVLEALGNPARVAENIRRDLYGAGYGDGYTVRKPVTGRELTEYGAAVEEDRKQEEFRQNTMAQGPRQEEPVYAGATGAGQRNPQPYPNWQNNSQGASGQAGKKPLSTGMIVLIVILCIFGSPLIAGALGGILGILGGLLGLVVAWFAMILGFGIAALVCMVAGIVISFIGVAGLGIHPLAGLGLIGGGFITIAIGLLFMILTGLMAGVATPAIFRGIRHLFSRKKKA